MKKLILVQAIFILLFCQYSSAFNLGGTMNSLALQIYTTLTNKEVSQNEFYGSDGMTKLAQQIKAAAQSRQNGTNPLKTGPLMGVHNPNANQTIEKVVPEHKMTKLAKSIMSAFAANNTPQNTNQTQNSNSTSPVKPVVVVPEVKQNTTNTTNTSNTTNTTQTVQNNTVTDPPVVVVEANKTQESNKTVQNNTTVAEPVIVVVENNKTIETNQTTTTEAPQVNQTKPTIPPVQSTQPIGIEKTEIPKLEVEAECGDKIQHSLAIIYNLGVHAAAGNVEKVRRDYDALKNITESLNKACYKSFSINIKTRPFFNNTGVCEAELGELQKLAVNYNQNSKDMISFAKTLQNFWYRHENFVSSCIASPVVGIEKTQLPEMKVEDECANKIEHSLAIIYNLGIHSAAQNVEKVRRDYDALKTITVDLNKVCSKSFSINVKPRPFFNNTGVCEFELSELQKLAINYNQNSKDMISFAKTLQNFWYRHHNFVSSCMESTTIGIEKTEAPEMKVEPECANKIEHSFAIIYDLGVHSAAGNIEKVRRDYDALKTITLGLNKACSKSFSINIHPHPFFNNTGICGSELSELQKLAMNYNKNSKDMISFAKTLQNFWYRHQNFVSSCVDNNTINSAQQSDSQAREQRETNCILSFAEAISAVNKMNGNLYSWNPSASKALINNLLARIAGINNFCDAKFSINVEGTQTQGNCQKSFILLKSAVENFASENSKDLNVVSQALRQISLIGKQVLNYC